MSDERHPMSDVTAALVALAEAGIRTDIQDLLIAGDPMRGIAPGALQKAIAAAIASHRDDNSMLEPSMLRSDLQSLLDECRRPTFDAGNARRQIGDRLARMIEDYDQRSRLTRDIAERIQEVIDEESADGAACGWSPCTGCHETEDGHPVGTYPHSKTFGADLGAGCRECGGLGVVWTHYSATDLAAMRSIDDATVSQES